MRYLFNKVKLNDYEKKYIEDKISKTQKLLSHYSENELNGEVEVDLDKRNFFRVEVMIKTPHNLYRVEKTNDTLMNTVDMVEEALMKQIKRNKEKTRDLQRKER